MATLAVAGIAGLAALGSGRDRQYYGTHDGPAKRNVKPPLKSGTLTLYRRRRRSIRVAAGIAVI
jgi:hypothetical protein